jgi:hypothetical protein
MQRSIWPHLPNPVGYPSSLILCVIVSYETKQEKLLHMGSETQLHEAYRDLHVEISKFLSMLRARVRVCVRAWMHWDIFVCVISILDINNSPSTEEIPIINEK